MKIVYNLLLLFLLFFTACSDSSKKNEQKPSVVVTTFAIYDVAKFLAKNELEVSMLIPFGQEIHTFEPTPKDIIKLQKSSLFFYNGAGLEPWTKKFNTIKKGIDLSCYVTLHALDVSNKEIHHHNHHGGIDPHYWLDFDNMQKVVKEIARMYIDLLPSKKDIFQKRSKDYIQMLKDLDLQYREALGKKCHKQEIFVNHNAYAYLSDRYGFKIDSLVGLSPESSSNPKIIEKMIYKIRTKQVRVLFCEQFENNAIMKTLASDTNSSVEILHPLANITKDEAQAKENYKSLMLKNLQKLVKAMECNGV